MPMTVTCTGCGKKLNVRDELAGKKLKCPACGATFEAKASSGAAPAGGTRAPTTISKKDAAGGAKLSISWGFIAMIVGVLAIPTLVILWIVGPMAVKKKWDAMAGRANDDIVNVATFALQADLSNSGDWNPNKSGNDPRVEDPSFIFNPFVMSLPASVPFQGSSSSGKYKGMYHTDDGQIEIDMDIGGGVTLFGKVKEANRKIHVVGHYKDGKSTAEIDGKPAKIHYPPKEE